MSVMLKGLLPGKMSFQKLSAAAVVSFFITFALCVLLICFSVINKTGGEKLKMERLIIEKSAKTTENLSRLLYKTHILSALITNSGGGEFDFERVAAAVYDDDNIANLLLAPGGVVSDVYPLNGNESVVGFDYFSDSAGNIEAAKAMETGGLVFGGPFESVQGSKLLVGRLPVYIDSQDGGQVFWGFVSVGLKYPEVLDSAGLDDIKSQGYDYELWRINPDSGEKQIIAESGGAHDGARYIEKHIAFLGSDWFFRILPVRAWYEYADTWFFVFVGMFISFLFAMIVQSHSDMRILKNNFENLSHIDPLTGIYNRRYFMELASSHIDRSLRLGTGAYFIILDIDNFKNINDTYGHPTGDDAIIGIAQRVKSNLRPYDLLSRHGGEEFVILATDITKQDVMNFAERLRAAIADKPFRCGGMDLDITASFGIAEIHGTEECHRYIEHADKAMYLAKKAGRNNAVFYESV